MANTSKIQGNKENYTYRIEQMFDIKFEQAFAMVEYMDMVLKRNEQINLTAVKDWDDAFEKHILDSLFITRLNEYEKAKNILDVGTGAGFPGALLAICSPDKEFMLLDSTLKKLKIIDEFVSELGVKNISTVHARAEELNKQEPYSKNFDLVVSRAVANFSKLLEWTMPFLKEGGCLVAFKGENYQEEIDAAKDALKKYEANVNRIEKYQSDIDSIAGHVLIIVKKI
ncbi:MAG: 16S rRNA (guanine(527)-N(7))-methyltransferase RsmG [Alphaproteobacteria bacterium]|nr:16S rRNA (guanine(527)-N(7))-methyltransferase RsmG [Alphaproteobacteria bacterium]